MLGDVTIYANGKAVMVLRGGKVISAAPGYTATVVRQGLGPGHGRGRHRGRGAAVPPGQTLKGDSLFGMGEDSLFGPVTDPEVVDMALGAVINTIPLYADLDTEAEATQKTFADEDATRFEGLDGDDGGLF